MATGADNEIALELNIDSNVPETTANVDTLTESIDKNTQSVVTGKEAYSQFRSETRAGLGNLLSLKKGTEEYNTELKRLASHKAEFAELSLQLQALNPNRAAANFAAFAQTATKALQGLGGAAALLAGSNEEMVKTFIQTQAAVEVLSALADVQELKLQAMAIWTEAVTVAQKLWNAAMNAWPITAIIAGITAIIAIIGEWNHTQEKIIEQQEKIIEHLQKTKELYNSTSEAIKGNLQNELNLLIAQNAEYDKIEKKRKELHDHEVTTATENLILQQKENVALQKKADANQKQIEAMPFLQSAWKNIFDLIAGDAQSTIVGGLEKIIDKQKEFNDQVTHGKNKATDLKNAVVALTTVEEAEKLKREQKTQREADLQVQRMHDESLKESRSKELALLRDQHNEDLEGLDKTSKQYNQMRLAYDAKYYADRKLLFKKYTQEDEDARNAFFISQINDTKEAQDKNTALYDKHIKEDIDNKIAGEDLQLLIDQKAGNKRAAIQTKFRKDLLASELLDAKESAIAIKQAEKDKNDSLDQLDKDRMQSSLAFATSTADALVSIGQLLLAKGKEQTDGTKALALIQLGMKEAVSIANVVASATDPLNPANLATGGIAAIANIAAGVASVAATFVSAKNILDGGGSTSSTSTPNFSSINTSAPSFTATQFNNTPTSTKSGNVDYGYNGQMTKVYVTQTDLTASQNLAYIQNNRRRIR